MREQIKYKSYIGSKMYYTSLLEGCHGHQTMRVTAETGLTGPIDINLRSIPIIIKHLEERKAKLESYSKIRPHFKGPMYEMDANNIDIHEYFENNFTMYFPYDEITIYEELEDGEPLDQEIEEHYQGLTEFVFYISGIPYLAYQIYQNENEFTYKIERIK